MKLEFMFTTQLRFYYNQSIFVVVIFANYLRLISAHLVLFLKSNEKQNYETIYMYISYLYIYIYIYNISSIRKAFYTLSEKLEFLKKNSIIYNSIISYICVGGKQLVIYACFIKTQMTFQFSYYFE